MIHHKLICFELRTVKLIYSKAVTQKQANPLRNRWRLDLTEAGAEAVLAEELKDAPGKLRDMLMDVAIEKQDARLDPREAEFMQKTIDDSKTPGMSLVYMHFIYDL